MLAREVRAGQAPWIGREEDPFERCTDERTGGYPTPVICAKSAQMIENAGDSDLLSAKECVRV